MSERHQGSHESAGSPESHAEHEHRAHEVLQEKKEHARAAEKAHHDQLEHARREAHEHAEAGRKIESEELPSELTTHTGHQLLKKDAYEQLLKHTQAKLSGPSRAFSKLIHSPKIEAISELGGKTVARPSGLLGGGIGAFLGSTTLLYTSKHYGFTYNYALFLILFAGGFFAGLVVELLIKLVTKKR